MIHLTKGDYLFLVPTIDIIHVVDSLPPHEVNQCWIQISFMGANIDIETEWIIPHFSTGIHGPFWSFRKKCWKLP